LSDALNDGSADGAFDIDMAQLAAPLPRAYEFVDGSAYLPHVERVRRARGAEVPESFYTDPLMYQATSAGFYGPRESVRVVDEAHGHRPGSRDRRRHRRRADGGDAEQAATHIQLVGLVNDVSLRNLIPGELAKGFGFLQSKPRSALSPVFVTPDELGDAWRDNKLHLPLLTHINGEWFGCARGGVDMQFDFAQLVAHAAKTRPLSAAPSSARARSPTRTPAGRLVLCRTRTVETLEHGKPLTPFMSFGDLVRIEMLDRDGASIFGAIEQRIERQPLP
jgi:fumarylacetoacetate (FAA) hydrolase